MTTAETIRTAVEAYDRGDIETLSALLHDRICYTINADPEIGPYRANCHTKQEFFDAVGTIQADWNIDSYRIADLIVKGNRGAAQIRLQMTSQLTGRTKLSGLALFVTAEDGLMTEIHEYNGTALAGTARLE